MTAKLRLITFSLLASATGAFAAPAVQVSVTSEDSAALQQWALGIENYLVIREQAAQIAPPPRFPMSAAELLRAEDAFAAEIRARRGRAREGDLFTFDVRRTFRKVIAQTLSEHQIASADLIARVWSDIVPRASRPAVNRRFPWQLGLDMPPCVLAALPQLPKEIQYRLVGHDLILFDLDANLVIDILREALPRPTVPAGAAGRR